MYLVFDIGGTKMRLANSFDGKNFQNVEIHQTPQEFDKALEIIQKFIWKADSTHSDNQFCVGLPGVFDKEKTTLVTAPNLPLWIGRPLKKKLEDIAKTKVILTNDAALAGLGEAVKGSGKARKIVAYISIGTGVGGVRIVNRKIDESTYGFEPGHQMITINTDWEGFIGGRGIKERYGKDAEDLVNEKIWEEINQNLAMGLINTIVHWSPDIVVLGGSVAQNKNVSIEKVSTEIKLRLRVFPKIPDIVKGELGDKAGLFGGLELLKIQHVG